mgnify:FL=1
MTTTIIGPVVSGLSLSLPVSTSPPRHDKESITVLKLGYKASAEQFAPAKLLDFACQAEAVGFDSVFVSDHFQPWKHVDGHAPYSLAWLGALGARTSRVVMGTSVLTPTFRYHPSIVAQAFGTLGAMFPRRVILGIGTGEIAERGAVDRPALARVQGALRPHARGGDPDPHAVARRARQLRGPVLSSTEKATIYDRPEIEVPIYVGGGRRPGRALCRPRRATASSAPAARSGSSIPRRCCPRSPRASPPPPSRRSSPTTT